MAVLASKLSLRRDEPGTSPPGSLLKVLLSVSLSSPIPTGFLAFSRFITLVPHLSIKGAHRDQSLPHRIINKLSTDVIQATKDT